MGLGFEKRHQIISIDDVIFKGVMVRLMLVLAPIMCVVGGIGISSILTLYMRNYIEQANKQSSTSKSSGTIHYDKTRLSDDYGSNLTRKFNKNVHLCAFLLYHELALEIS